MSWYLYRLLPHRPDFNSTVTSAERETMAAHLAYWSGHLSAGTVLIFSPVADPARSWGLAIVRAEEGQLGDLRGGDPAVQAGIADADFLLLPMPIVAVTTPS
jgi:hypothetical protein